MEITLEILFLPAIILIGVLSSVSDLKYGKVKNSLIKKGFLYGLWIYFFLFVWTIIRKTVWFPAILNLPYLKMNYFSDVVINVVITFLFSVILWEFKFLSAGESKLFILYSFLVPLIFYKKALPYFPFLSVFINTFIIGLAYLTVVGLVEVFKKITKINKLSIKKIFTRDLIIKILQVFVDFIPFSLFFYLISLLSPFLPPKTQTVILISLVFILKPINKLMKKKEAVILFSVLLAASVFINPILFINDMKRRFGLYFVFILILGWIFSFAFKKEYEAIEISQLKENMVLDKKSLNRLKPFESQIGKIYPDGLTKEQVELIKKIYRDKNLEKVEISKTFPLSPIIFFGVLATIISYGSCILKWINFF